LTLNRVAWQTARASVGQQSVNTAQRLTHAAIDRFADYSRFTCRLVCGDCLVQLLVKRMRVERVRRLVLEGGARDDRTRHCLTAVVVNRGGVHHLAVDVSERG